ncbi:MAG: sigma-70 family RNA polymerase sigma factor [Burkholderiales bacterium]
MHSSDPDAGLVRLAQLGDARAFEALVVKYQRRIARHVARYVKRASDVEDVVQEVFIKAYRGIASFKGESVFYTWMYRIAKNTALNFVTRQSKFVVLQEDLAPSESGEPLDVGSDAEDPERLLLAKQISETVGRAMTQLRPELAEALLLYEVEGKQYKEIAQMLTIPIGTVRTRIFRAREFIAQRLEPVVGPFRDRRW